MPAVVPASCAKVPVQATSISGWADVARVSPIALARKTSAWTPVRPETAPPWSTSIRPAALSAWSMLARMPASYFEVSVAPWETVTVAEPVPFWTAATAGALRPSAPSEPPVTSTLRSAPLPAAIWAKTP